MTAFIDDHRDVYGVEPICKALPIAAGDSNQTVSGKAGAVHRFFLFDDQFCAKCSHDGHGAGVFHRAARDGRRAGHPESPRLAQVNGMRP